MNIFKNLNNLCFTYKNIILISINKINIQKKKYLKTNKKIDINKLKKGTYLIQSRLKGITKSKLFIKN